MEREGGKIMEQKKFVMTEEKERKYYSETDLLRVQVRKLSKETGRMGKQKRGI